MWCSMLFLCVNVYCHRVTTQLQLINIIIIIIQSDFFFFRTGYEGQKHAEMHNKTR